MTTTSTTRIDSFGVTHTDTCPFPNWTTVPNRNGHGTVQRCRCGVIWRPGDPSTPPQPATYGKRRR